MKTSRRLCFGVLLVVYTGCVTTPGVQSRGDTSDRFIVYHTFAVLPVATSADLSPAVAKELVDAAEKGARDALVAQGYTEASRDSADLVVYLHGKSMAPVALTDLGYLPTPSRFGLAAAEIAATADHRVFVEAYDNHSRQQVWLGWLECSCAKVVPERIRREIHEILETFPARGKTENAMNPNDRPVAHVNF